MKKIQIFSYIYILGMLLSVGVAKAQNQQYAQFHHSPLLTNPAMVASDNDLKALFHYRHENLSNGFSYSNPMLSVVYPLITQQLDANGQVTAKKRWGGVGLGLMQDQTAAGNGGALQTLGFSGTYAHNLQLADNHFISFGAQGTYYRKSLNSSNLTTASQILNTGNQEALLANDGANGYFSLGLGAMWYQSNAIGGVKNYFSVSANHLNQPNYNFRDIGNTNRLPYGWVFSGGYEVWNNGTISIQPNFRWTYNENDNQFNIGALGHYALNSNHHLGAGVWATRKAFVGSIEYTYKNLLIGISSDLSYVSESRGTVPEIVIGYRKTLGGRKKKKKEPKKVVQQNTEETITSETPTAKYTIKIVKDAAGNVISRDTIKTESLTTEELTSSETPTHSYKIKLIKDKNGNVVRRDTLEAKMKDKDGDGVADVNDNCPDEAGTLANKGCPETISKAKLSDIQKELARHAHSLHFASGKTTINDESIPDLKAILAIMKKYPKNKFNIEGHSDNVGNAANNLRLSQQRANSVRQYFVNNGIAASRLIAKGYGQTRPEVSNATAAGRKKNRRIEVLVVQ
ncbi:PorP/SprF family type IX secretion system membrane protein [Microscilla marina]|uniref:OmpA domain protein n=1 Tax=Microscilla marina ATCC 23134 TaxID=313606 RepID=A1ZQP3_MICM2|nr:PorP/SprF family type IX secretion system membrane protein [Microscilla marina]EAY27198.1 OmpA domain protein [Microscilla marina ATCC 23134]